MKNCLDCDNCPPWTPYDSDDDVTLISKIPSCVPKQFIKEKKCTKLIFVDHTGRVWVDGGNKIENCPNWKISRNAQ